MNPPLSRSLRSAPWVVAALLSIGCQDRVHQGGCLSGAEDCSLPTPCEAVTFSCDDTALEVRVLGAVEAAGPGGWSAIASEGDVLLANGRARAVIAALGNQNLLDPNGGSLLDLSTPGSQNDGLNQMLQVAGILPEDSFRYTELRVIDERPARVGVELRGALDGRPGVRVSTLYELRPCDPGVRVRSELSNGTSDPYLFLVADGFFWGKGGVAPFAPIPGQGFEHPSFGLTTIDGVFRDFPYMSARLHSSTPDGSPGASYTHVGCSLPLMQGFHSNTISAVGTPKRLVQPRDFTVFERFMVVAEGEDLASSADLALEIRRQLFEEPWITVTGTVERPGALGHDQERATSVVIREGTLTTPAAEQTPWTQVTADATGTFQARIPAGKDYVVEVHSFGKMQVERAFEGGTTDAQLGAFVLPSTARVSLRAHHAVGGTPLFAQLFVVPVDGAVREATHGSFHGQFADCAPYLGPAGGPSPACNTVVLNPGLGDDPTVVEIPTGEFHIYAFKGPFWTMDRQTVTLNPTDSELTFTLSPLPLQPEGTLNADLHVHGAASFDSSVPDLDRVLSFAAGELEVIATTDHDVVYDYADTIAALGLSEKMSSIAGLETTGHIPYLRVPDYAYPLVVGHYNFWPLTYDPSQPRNGAPFDEYQEPGQIFDRLEDEGRWASAVPVIQLNHPYDAAQFGRDLGFPRAILLDATQDLPAEDDGSGNAVYVRGQGRNANDSHHAQEVMNGSSNNLYLAHRAFWFYLLNQGRLRTGTANSDTHALADNTAGVPRTVVWTPAVVGSGFDVDEFNGSLRAGQALGTNGPVIEARIGDAGDFAGARLFGLQPFQPAAGARLFVKLSAAPWVPVEELRIVVNGEVVKTVPSADLTHPADPWGSDGLLRYEGDFAVSELVAGITGDAWIVVEAGRALLLAGDLGGGRNKTLDGIPDTTDNDGDGEVDARDVEDGAAFGPLKNPPLPADESDPQFHFSAVTGGAPAAFTNPFVLDLNGNDQFDAPGVTGGR